jgi:hypothetical protein
MNATNTIAAQHSTAQPTPRTNLLVVSLVEGHGHDVIKLVDLNVEHVEVVLLGQFDVVLGVVAVADGKAKALRRTDTQNREWTFV